MPGRLRQGGSDAISVSGQNPTIQVLILTFREKFLQIYPEWFILTVHQYHDRNMKKV